MNPNNAKASSDELSRVCAGFIDALYKARAEVADRPDLYEHPQVASAQKRMWITIGKIFPPEKRPVSWEADVAWVLAGYFDRIWHAQEAERDQVVSDLTTEVSHSVETIADTPWLAVLPLERRFESFGRHVSLGQIAIVNPRQPGCVDDQAMASCFAGILQEKYGVAFLESSEVAQAFWRELPSILDSSCHTIPSNPQLVIPLGFMGPNSAWGGALSTAFSYLPLVACSVLIYDCVMMGKGVSAAGYGLDEDKPQGAHSFAATCRPLPPYGLALNVRTGVAMLLDTVVSDWEALTVSGRPGEWRPIDPIDEDKFLKCWSTVGNLLLLLQKKASDPDGGINPKFAKAVERSIQLMAKCKYSLFHHLNDLVFHAVIATETILDPFETEKEGLKERFALFGSALASRTTGDRLRWYEVGREMYIYRSKAGHQAMVCDQGKETSFHARDAVCFFYLCLIGICKWVQECIASGEQVSQSTFMRLYRSCVLP